jgi:hypothetical protein
MLQRNLSVSYQTKQKSMVNLNKEIHRIFSICRNGDTISRDVSNRFSLSIRTLTFNLSLKVKQPSHYCRDNDFALFKSRESDSRAGIFQSITIKAIRNGERSVALTMIYIELNHNANDVTSCSLAVLMSRQIVFENVFYRFDDRRSWTTHAHMSDQLLEYELLTNRLQGTAGNPHRNE